MTTTTKKLTEAQKNMLADLKGGPIMRTSRNRRTAWVLQDLGLVDMNPVEPYTWAAAHRVRAWQIILTDAGRAFLNG